jgi:galactokinase
VAPGRVNLIGEHVDYTGGFVLPFAIEYCTVVYGYGEWTKTSGSSLRVISDLYPNDPLIIENFTLEDALNEWKPNNDRKWTNYVIGVIKEYLPQLMPTSSIKGLNMTVSIASNVPTGGGLSSSASLLVAMATFLECLLVDTTNDGKELLSIVYPTANPYEIQRALKCQHAEQYYCSTPCGIMDQFVSSAAQPNSLLLIDCEHMSFTTTELPAATNVCFVVCNSHVKHDNANGEYPIRVQQCQQALTTIQQALQELLGKDVVLPTSLRHVTIEHLNLLKANTDKYHDFLLSVLWKRTHHVVTENQRVSDCAKALQKADWDTVGTLMTASHTSMKVDYEVSCDEIDSLVQWALNAEGVYGSRLTGGGFGGCTVTLCDVDKADALMETLQQKFQETYNKSCTCFITVPEDGVRRVLL